MKAPSIHSLCAPAILGLVASVLVLSPREASAQTTTFNSGDGDYLNAARWNSGVPTGSINAAINGNRTATLSGSAPTVGLAMNIGASTPTAGTLVLNTGASLTVTGATTLLSFGSLGSGMSGRVTQNGGLFTGSTINIGSGLASGQTPANTDAALYTMNGGTLSATTLNVAGGSSLKGSMVMTGGTVTTTTLSVGQNGAAGNLSISGGNMTVSGALNMQAAGAVNIGTSIISVSGGSLTLNTGSAIAINSSLNSQNAKSISVSGTGVVNLGGRSTAWANIGATAEYGVVTVSGGELNFQNANTILGNNSTFTGGKVTGLNTLTNNAMTINGSEFHVGSNTAAASTTLLDNVAGTSFTLTSGTLVLGAYGNNSADIFFKNDQAAADLTGGSIVVDFKYAPTAGDSFNFIDWTAGTMSLSTSNISATSYANDYSVVWNTSQWVSDGILSVTSVTAVPEPSTWALLISSLMAVVIFRRRRATN